MIFVKYTDLSREVIIVNCFVYCVAGLRDTLMINRLFFTTIYQICEIMILLSALMLSLQSI